MDNTTEPFKGNFSSTTSSRGIALIVVESSLFVFLDLSTLFGNFLVCLAIHRNASLKTITNVFVLSLAISDLLMAVVVMSLSVCSSIADRWLFGDIGIKMDGYLGHCLGGISLTTLTMIAINRYVRVVRPSVYSTFYTKKTATIMVILAWLATFLLVGLCFTFAGIEFRASAANPTRSFPFFVTKEAFILFNTMHTGYITLPGLVMLVCYVKIYRVIRQHNAAVAPSLNAATNSSYQSVEEAKMTKLLAVVLAGFYVCWFPAFITGVLRFFMDINGNALRYFNFYYTIPAYASSMINPIIYSTMSSQFRMEFVRILRRK